MAQSEIILTSNTHGGDSAVQTITGEKYKGDGYYSRSDGLHTVQYNFQDLTGTINIQATLAVNPVDADWFTVHSYTAAQESDNKFANFTGNYVWVRAYISNWTDGTIDSIALNH